MHTILFERVKFGNGKGDPYVRAVWTDKSGLPITVGYLHVDEFRDMFGVDAYNEITKHESVELEINVKGDDCRYNELVAFLRECLGYEPAWGIIRAHARALLSHCDV